MSDASYRKIVHSWSMYDWANSAFFTTIVSAVFPPFYRSLATNAGMSDAAATAFWAYTTSVALLGVALLGPLLGAISDQTGGKKRWLGGFATAGILATALMVLLQGDAYLWGSLLFIIGGIGVSGGNIFYDSLLPHIAREGDLDEISTRGYALGYVGGGTLLVVNMLMILHPGWFGLADQQLAVRFSFLSVAIWWALFSLPLFLNVPDPPPLLPEARGRSPLKAGFRQLMGTLQKLRRYRQLAIFLIAFLIYNDGIGTIIKMATAYGDEIGIGVTDMIAALVITQFVGVPCSFAFGRLAKSIGGKRSILIGLGVYTLISILAFFMTNATHFYVLAFMVGLVQGGTQALSRSLYSSMVPRSQSAEFFGFFSTSSKVAGVSGPLIFGLLSQLLGGSRLSILSLICFFLVGGLILLAVDEKEGRRVAREEDARLGYV